MALAPPFVSTPGDPGRDAVQGRIARAATRRALQRNLERSLGAVDDGDDAPGSEPRSSSRPASGFARLQGSPGVAHSPGRVIPVPVAAVASPSHRDLRGEDDPVAHSCILARWQADDVDAYDDTAGDEPEPEDEEGAGWGFGAGSLREWASRSVALAETAVRFALDGAGDASPPDASPPPATIVPHVATSAAPATNPNSPNAAAYSDPGA
mgnify:CR=1 FL=1